MSRVANAMCLVCYARLYYFMAWYEIVYARSWSILCYVLICITVQYYVTLGCFPYPVLSYFMSCYAKLCLAILREVMRCSAKNVYAMLRYAMPGMAMLFRLNVWFVTLWYGRRMVMLHSVMVFHVVVMVWFDTQCFLYDAMCWQCYDLLRVAKAMLCYDRNGLTMSCYGRTASFPCHVDYVVRRLFMLCCVILLYRRSKVKTK